LRPLLRPEIPLLVSAIYRRYTIRLLFFTSATDFRYRFRCRQSLMSSYARCFDSRRRLRCSVSVNSAVYLRTCSLHMITAAIYAVSLRLSVSPPRYHSAQRQAIRRCRRYRYEESAASQLPPALRRYGLI
jgi:hypothetical protein